MYYYYIVCLDSFRFRKHLLCDRVCVQEGFGAGVWGIIIVSNHHFFRKYLYSTVITKFVCYICECTCCVYKSVYHG